MQRDLFSQFDDEAVYLLDRALLVKLAEAELKKTADRLAKRWKWVEIQIDPDWDRIHTLHMLRGAPGTPTAAEQKRLDELGDQMQDIADNPPMDPAEQGAAYARGQALSVKYEKLEARIAARTKYRPEDMRIAGCIVTLKGARADVIAGARAPGGRAAEAEEGRQEDGRGRRPAEHPRGVRREARGTAAQSPLRRRRLSTSGSRSRGRPAPRGTTRAPRPSTRRPRA